MAPSWTCGLDDPAVRAGLGERGHEELLHEVALLDTAGTPFDNESVPGRQALARLLWQRDDQLRARAVPRSVRGPRAAATSPAELRRGPIDADSDRFSGFVFKNPGEHGSQPPRPRRLRARLLRSVHPGGGGQPRPHRSSLHHEPHHAVPGAGADHDRPGVCGRHPRRVGRRQPAHRRHAWPSRRRSSSRGCPASRPSTSSR